MGRKVRSALGWLAMLVAGAALGLGAAWLEQALAIPNFIVQSVFVIAMAVVAGFAAWAAWRYYRAIGEENDWD
ncbi:MAG: hypothetical protein K8S25_13030 [Alphaproteobacteria bacterium]|nr:hypothetical protein [Alphaproteobacteria bacterium]